MSAAKQQSEGQERRILVAVDDGEESSNALRWCLRQVVDDSPGSADTLVLLYVIPPEVLYTSTTSNRSGYLFFSRDVIEGMQQYGKEVADSVLRKAKAACSHLKNVKVQTRIERGEPGEVICGMTATLGADLLVMGSRDCGIIKRAFTGSVSKYCSKRAKCPVFVVKRPKHGQTLDEASAKQLFATTATCSSKVKV